MSLNKTGNTSGQEPLQSNQGAPDATVGSQHTQGPRSSAAPGYDPGRPRERNRMISLFAGDRLQVQPEDVTTFNKQITTTLEQEFKGLDVSIQQHNTVPSVFLVSVIKNTRRIVYLLCYSHMVRGNDTLFTPLSDKITATERLLETSSNWKNTEIAGNLLVTPEAIQRCPANTIETIASAIHDKLDPKVITLKDLSSDLNLEVISSDVDRVRQFIADRNPTEVQPRIDWGFLVSVRVPRDMVDRLNDIDQMEVQEHDMTNHARAILAVGGYVQFRGPFREQSRMGQTIERFEPNITVTAMASVVDHPIFSAIAITAVQDLLVVDHAWADYYLNEDAVGVNISNLYRMQNDTSRLDDTPPLDFMADRNEIFYPPIVTLEVRVGEKVPMFWHTLAVSNSITDRWIIEETERALGIDNHLINNILAESPSFKGVATIVGIQYQGVFNHRGTWIDTRYVDFLNKVRELGVVDDDPESARAMNELLTIHHDPVSRLNTLMPFFGGANNFRSLYNTAIVAIAPDFARALSSAFASQRITIEDKDAARRRGRLNSLSSVRDNAHLSWGNNNSGTFSGYGGGRRNTSTWSSPMGFHRR